MQLGQLTPRFLRLKGLPGDQNARLSEGRFIHLLKPLRGDFSQPPFFAHPVKYTMTMAALYPVFQIRNSTLEMLV
ncbi:hypothetical protein CJP46_03725 [Paenibacillus sp. XY044]|nr:hypothetical protein CJP46_03725 [Paenibacillus sp. XY044]